MSKELEKAAQDYSDAVIELAEATKTLAAQTARNWEQIARSGRVIKSLVDEAEERTKWGNTPPEKGRRPRGRRVMEL